MSALTICAHVSIDGTGKIPVYVFRLDEALFEIPRYSVEIAAEQDPLETYLGKDVVISPVELQSGQGDTPRTFAGIVTEAELVTEDGGLQMIRLTVRPPVAVLGLSRSSAVYLNKTSVDIFEEVLKRNGLERYRVVASALSTQREICIQYNENDLDFVRRLLAEDGIRLRVLDLRWLAPLPMDVVAQQAHDVGRVLVVDECRATGGGIADAVVAGLVEGGSAAALATVRARDSYVPLGPAASQVLVTEDDVVAASRRLARSGRR